MQLHSVVFLELPAGLLKRFLCAKIAQGTLQCPGLAATLQTGQLLERPLAAVVLGTTQIRGLNLNPAEGAQPAQRLPPVQVASSPATGAKGA